MIRNLYLLTPVRKPDWDETVAVVVRARSSAKARASAIVESIELLIRQRDVANRNLAGIM